MELSAELPSSITHVPVSLPAREITSILLRVRTDAPMLKENRSNGPLLDAPYGR